MCHIDALSKWQLQHFVSECNRSINYMHIEFAGIVSKFFKFQELKLDAKWSILHFKGPGDLLVRNKLMDCPIESVLVSFRIGCFKLVTSMLFILQFQHFRSHPLLNNVGLLIRFKK